MTARRGLPWAIFLAGVGLTAGAAVMATLNARAGVGEFSLIDLLWASSWFGLSAVGALVASRRPENRVGWLACTFALPISLLLFANEYARYAVVTRPGSLPGGKFMFWMSQWPFFVAGAIGVFVVLLFPDGRLPSKRWRVVAWLTPAAAAIGVVGAMFGSAGSHEIIKNPLMIPGLEALFEKAQVASGNLLVGGIVLSFFSAIPRLLHARGEERQQMKLFFYGFGLMLAIFLAGFFLESVLGRIPEPFDTLLFVAAVLSLPAGIAVAILRYRLYEIDVVINKTVVFGALAAFITAVYVGVVVGIGSLMGAGKEPNLALSLAATAIVAVAFQPVRQRVQRFANRLVYGERVTPYETVTSFSHRMAESLSLDQMLPQMAEAAAKGVGGNRSQVKLFLPSGAEQVLSWPTDSSGNRFDRTILVTHQGEPVGEISVGKAPGEQITKSEDKLLQDLASQAGLAMRNLRLTGELQQKLIELQESRKRIVAAQDEERRRMERDIHDGAQQQLVSMAVKLGLAGNIAPRDSEKAAALLDELKGEAEEALETLRDLARGLFPQVLVDQGLVAAVESHIQKMGLNARVEDRLGARIDLEIEANAYFCIREALQNASKHAKGAAVEIRLNTHDGQLGFTVKDKGPGFDPNKVRMGSGLQNMKDRIEALGGLLTIESVPGHGTIIKGRVPV